MQKSPDNSLVIQLVPAETKYCMITKLMMSWAEIDLRHSVKHART